jgi:hypothetical protein
MRLHSIFMLLLTLPVLAAPVVEHRRADKVHPGYTIEFKPGSVPASNAAARASVERLATRRVKADIDAFKKAYATDSAGPLAWTFDESDSVISKTPRYTTLRFLGNDFRGGPHGSPLLSVLTYEPTTGREIPVSHFFKPGSNYLRVLSRYTRAELRRRATKTGMLASLDETIMIGTAPKADNFQVVYPGPKALVVVFPAYQVASYADGPQTVEIPYSALRGIIAPGLALR